MQRIALTPARVEEIFRDNSTSEAVARLLDSYGLSTEEAFGLIENTVRYVVDTEHALRYQFCEQAYSGIAHLVRRDPELAVRALGWIKHEIERHGPGYYSILLLKTVFENPQAAKSYFADSSVAAMLARSATPGGRDIGTSSDKFRSMAREALADLLKAQPDNPALREGALPPIQKAISSRNLRVRENGYAALEATLDNIGEPYSRYIIPLITRNLLDPPKTAAPGSRAVRVPQTGRDLLGKLISRQEGGIPAEILIACARAAAAVTSKGGPRIPPKQDATATLMAPAS